MKCANTRGLTGKKHWINASLCCGDSVNTKKPKKFFAIAREEMVINNDPNYKQKRAWKEAMKRPESERKADILSELSTRSSSVLNLALMYADMFEAFGIDLTQPVDLQEVYNRGYEDGFYERQRRLQNSQQDDRQS